MKISTEPPEKTSVTPTQKKSLEDHVTPHTYLGQFGAMDVTVAQEDVDYFATHEYKMGICSSIAVVVGSALIFSAVSYVLEQLFPEYF